MDRNTESEMKAALIGGGFKCVIWTSGGPRIINLTEHLPPLGPQTKDIEFIKIVTVFPQRVKVAPMILDKLPPRKHCLSLPKCRRY